MMNSRIEREYVYGLCQGTKIRKIVCIGGQKCPIETKARGDGSI